VHACLLAHISSVRLQAFLGGGKRLAGTPIRSGAHRSATLGRAPNACEHQADGAVAGAGLMESRLPQRRTLIKKGRFTSVSAARCYALKRYDQGERERERERENVVLGDSERQSAEERSAKGNSIVPNEAER
jgi:hypothetical protein